MNKTVIAVVVFVSAGLIGYASWAGFIKPSSGEEFLGAANAPVSSAITTSTDVLNLGQDVVGTHIGTTTLGVAFPERNVTTTYISKIGGLKRATYQVKIMAATNTVNNLNLTVQGSNDGFCETISGVASSSVAVVQSNINWYDAMPYLLNRVHQTSLTNGSSSLIMNWQNATVGDTVSMSFDNLDFQCLRLLLSASSTNPYISLKTRN